MLLNNNIITEILQSNFEDEIIEFTEETVMDMEPHELERIFDDLVDYGYLDIVSGIEAVSFETEERNQITTVSGDMHVRAFVEGYIHWDGENEMLDEREVELAFEYSFDIVDEKYTNLELAYV